MYFEFFNEFLGLLGKELHSGKDFKRNGFSVCLLRLQGWIRGCTGRRRHAAINTPTWSLRRLPGQSPFSLHPYQDGSLFPRYLKNSFNKKMKIGSPRNPLWAGLVSRSRPSAVLSSRESPRISGVNRRFRVNVVMEGVATRLNRRPRCLTVAHPTASTRPRSQRLTLIPGRR